jgi:hypothetical protein
MRNRDQGTGDPDLGSEVREMGFLVLRKHRMGRTLTMTPWLRAAGWLGICLLWMAGVGLVEAQSVTTTNEVRAMRGLGPVKDEGSETGDQGSGIRE